MYKFVLHDPHFLPHCGCQIEINLQRGQLLSIVGENGLGKSTLVQRFYENNRNIASMIEQRQLDYFYDRPVYKIKDIFLKAREKEISSNLLNHYWSSFGLDKKDNRVQSTLSGGEGQALKLCLGLSVEKEIYVLDEPSQFLDVNSKKVLKDIIQSRIHSGKTVLMVEHDLSWIDISMTVQRLKIENVLLVKGESWTT